MLRRPVYLVLVLALGLSSVAGLPARHACAAEPFDLVSARQALDRLTKALGSPRSVDAALLQGLDEVQQQYAAAAGAPADDKAVARFRSDVADAYLKALCLVKVAPGGKVNQREEVNLRAAELIGRTGDVHVSPALVKAMQNGLLAAKGYEPSQAVYDATFAALGRLNDPAALAWLAKEFIHTRSSPRRDVDQLVAALRGMLLFVDVPGRTRHAIVEKMVVLYTPVETQAARNSPDPRLQSHKVLWDRIRPDVVEVLQHFADGPTKDTGEALASMAEFQAWFRHHKDVRKAPWVPEAP